MMEKASGIERDQEEDEEPPSREKCPRAHYQRHAKANPRINL